MGALNEQIDTAKANADAQLRPIREEEARIERGIAEFATAHREDMGKLKSKQMTFGTVYFRKSTKLKLPAAAEKVREIIKRLRERGMEDCINQPEAKVNKEALKAYSPDVIVEVGASIEVNDSFSYELDTAQLR